MPRRTDIESILLIGSGPIVIGQASEFDYSGTQACRVLRDEGYRVILVNSNPATIMTDPEFADATYIEPLDVDVVAAIIEREGLPANARETHVSLFDGSNCGFELTDQPAFSVQYHPEASPGPQDSQYLFGKFVSSIG